jgi:hypothetical protein
LLGIKHTSCFIQNKSGIMVLKRQHWWLKWKNDEADTASYLLEFEYTWKNGSYSAVFCYYSLLYQININKTWHYHQKHLKTHSFIATDIPTHGY